MNTTFVEGTDPTYKEWKHLGQVVFYLSNPRTDPTYKEWKHG